MEKLLKTTYLNFRNPAYLINLVKKTEYVLKFTYQFFKKRAFIIHFGNKTYKLFTFRGLPSKHVEMNGNRGATNHIFWKQDIVKVKNNLFHFSMPKGDPVLLEDCGKAEKFIEEKLNYALTFAKKPISRSYDFTKISKLESNGLEPGLTAKVEKILNTVSLPITSAHGDLHAGNMIYINNEIKVIDWSMFSSQGSFITDYMHFYNYRLAKQHNESWTIAILRDEPYLKKLSEHCKLNIDLLRLAYCMRRISGEINQRRSLNDVLPKQIKKYNNILTYIVNEL